MKENQLENPMPNGQTEPQAVEQPPAQKQEQGQPQYEYDKRVAMLLQDLNEAREDAEYYKSLLATQQNQTLLNELKELDPAITSLSEMGEEFEKLLDAGISVAVAYGAVCGAKKEKGQPTMGDIKARGQDQDDLLSFEAVAAMSKDQIEKNYDKVMRSAGHWKDSKKLK